MGSSVGFKLPCVHISIICVGGFRSKELLDGGIHQNKLKHLTEEINGFPKIALTQDVTGFLKMTSFGLHHKCSKLFLLHFYKPVPRGKVN